LQIIYPDIHLNQKKQIEKHIWPSNIYILFCEQNVPGAIRIDKTKEETSEDKTLISLIKPIKSNDFSNNRNLNKYLKIKDELSVFQNKLVLRGSRIVIPESLQSKALKIAHEGHLGIVKTKQLIRYRVWFPGIDKMVETEIKQCSACQLVNICGYYKVYRIILKLG
jgi:hypothetical protein